MVNSMSHRCKVIFIGDTGVGKTSITNKIIRDKFDEHSAPTIGASFSSINYDDINVYCEFWDTAGQEAYDSMSKMFYRDAQIVILVIDSSRLKSIERIKPLIKNLHDVIDENDYELIIIANKIDKITDELQDKIMSMIHKNITRGKIIYTSAKTGQNIDTLQMLVKTTAKELKDDKKLRKNIKNNRMELDKQYDAKSWKRFICFMK